MADPTRLLEADSGASELERQVLLEDGSAFAPPPDAMNATWGAMAASMKAGVVFGGATKTVSASVLAKWGLIGVLVIGGAATGGALLMNSGPQASGPSSHPSSARGIVTHVDTNSGDRTDPAPPVESSPEVVPQLRPSVIKPASPASMLRPSEETQPTAPASSPAPPVETPLPSVITKVPSSQIAEEARLVREANEALARGDVEKAEEKLRQQGQLSRVVLDEEREVLSIEVLARQGKKDDRKKDEAKGRARSFLSTHPKSHLAARVQRVLAQ